MRNLIDILDFDTDEISALIKTAEDIMVHPEKYCDACRHRILGTLFFEPSTRTRLSFESAMLGLGGNVLGFSDSSSSSVSKGESVSDTVAVVSGYCDIIAMRHPKEGAPYPALRHSAVPVINAGDGGHYHPTQTLADLMTIHRHKSSFENLTVALCGDLKYGRTVHSLIFALARYSGVRFILISPDELKLPDFVKNGIEYTETDSLEDGIRTADVLYMTRVQKERFSDAAEYERLKNVYVLDEEKLKLAKHDMIVMHPLPRVGEISADVDDDPRCCYFEQTRCGRFIRMALILRLLSDISEPDVKRMAESFEENGRHCGNPRCITSCEQELAHRFYTDANGIVRCAYCDMGC